MRTIGSLIINGLIEIWRWCRVLWVCRVPAFSAFVGGGLLVLTVQARDFFADIGLTPWEWGFFLVMLLVWAWIVHVVARRALQHDDWIERAYPAGRLTADHRAQLQAEFHLPALVIPRFLGAAVLVLTGLAMWLSAENLAGAVDSLWQADRAKSHAELLAAIVALIAVVFIAGALHRRQIHERLAAATSQCPPPLPPLLAGSAPFPAQLLKRGLAAEISDLSWVDGALFAIAVLVTIAFGVALSAPHAVADFLPRALIAPLLFGGGVLFLGEVAAWSHRLRTPFLLIMVGVATLLAYAVGRFHDVRWTPPPAQAGGSAQIEFATAVERWKAANRAADGKYPRPIIIAGAGGASRAGFLTASVVGALLDLDGKEHFGKLRNRIFALSTVSGSSVAAVMIRAALADASDSGSPDQPPCKYMAKGAWFGSDRVTHRSQQDFDETKSWRDCFQQLVAGDFLSPVLVGIAYRDTFPLVYAFTGSMDDRAALLEQALERRYSQIVSNSPGACDEKMETGLCRRFGYHPDPSVANAWLPLIFVNGTSVATGRRIITGDVAAGSPTQLGVPLFRNAYDLLEIRRSAKKKRTPDAREQNVDIRLSTAATMSARFPIISPYGTLRDQTHDLADRIVDGGYFENDGLATAAGLASALKEYHLDPIVIRITNEPNVDVEADRKLGPGRPNLPELGQHSWLDGLTSIFQVMNATRSGHEDGFQAELDKIAPGRLIEIGVQPLETGGGQLCRYHPEHPAASTKFGLADRKRSAADARRPAAEEAQNLARLNSVSMSWWMSQPVQAYLDGQLCVSANYRTLECELRTQGFGSFDGCRETISAGNVPRP
jgi:hypothetical protein